MLTSFAHICCQCVILSLTRPQDAQEVTALSILYASFSKFHLPGMFGPVRSRPLFESRRLSIRSLLDP